MPVVVTCLECGKRLKASDKLAGKRVACPNCEAPLLVPAPSAAEGEQTYRLAAAPAPDEPPSPPSGPMPPRRRLRAESGRTVSEGTADVHEDAPAPLSASVSGAAPASPRRRRKAPRRLPNSDAGSQREYVLGLVVLCLALVPLAVMLFGGSDTAERLHRTIESHPQAFAQGGDLEALFARLPGGRIEGAHLPRGTWLHWLYAALSAGGFLGLMTLLFRGGSARTSTLVWTGLFTATVGILLLLAFQWVAVFTQGYIVYGRSIVVLLFWLVKFIGFSYRCALEDGNGIVLSFFGFTCGVGLCEEVVKALPIIAYLRGAAAADWRGACLVGLASGVGFGVSEGIVYSSDFYNGVATGGVYLVRFTSCVALHAAWSGIVALLMYRNQDWLHGDWEWGDLFTIVAVYLSGAIVLHGLYDTLLKQEMTGWALAIAAGTVAWLAWLVERSREAFDDPA